MFAFVFLYTQKALEHFPAMALQGTELEMGLGLGNGGKCRVWDICVGAEALPGAVFEIPHLHFSSQHVSESAPPAGIYKLR